MSHYEPNLCKAKYACSSNAMVNAEPARELSSVRVRPSQERAPSERRKKDEEEGGGRESVLSLDSVPP